MGSTYKQLAKKKISGRSIFNNRFAVEVCETMHLHYRNLRIVLSLGDFTEFAKGVIAAYERWKQRGCPEPKKGEHIELCRRKVASEVYNEGIQINLNRNLYNFHEGKIFAEGAGIKDNYYIHLKIKDLRAELTLSEYKVLSNAIREADKRLKDGDLSALLQTNRIYEKVHQGT